MVFNTSQTASLLSSGLGLKQNETLSTCGPAGWFQYREGLAVGVLACHHNNSLKRSPHHQGFHFILYNTTQKLVCNSNQMTCVMHRNTFFPATLKGSDGLFRYKATV